MSKKVSKKVTGNKVSRVVSTSLDASKASSEMQEMKESMGVKSITDIQSLIALTEKTGGKRGSISGFFSPEIVESLSNEIKKISFSIGNKEGLTLSSVKFIPVSSITSFIQENDKFSSECEKVQKKFDKRKNVVWSLASTAGRHLGLIQKTFQYKNKVNQIALVDKAIAK